MTIIMPNDVSADCASTRFSYTVEDTDDIVQEEDASDQNDITSASKTGDDNNIMIYIIGIGISSMLITGYVITKETGK